jgi:hypothetical protein
VQLFPCDSLAYTPTRLDGTCTESLKLQAWGSLNGTNLKPIPPILFLKKNLRKLGSTGTPSGQLAQGESVKYLLLKCFISC